MSKNKRLKKVTPVMHLDLPKAKERVEFNENDFKADSHKVTLGPGSKR